MALSLAFPWSTLIMKIRSGISNLIEIIALISMSSSKYAEHSMNKSSATFQGYDTGIKKACRFCLIAKIWGATQNSLETCAFFKDQIKENDKEEAPCMDLVPELDTSNSFLFSPRPMNQLNAAAVKLQKVYKSYRTRRNLADCAVVVEELWWKALDFASLKRSSISFFTDGKQETAASRWARARTRVAIVIAPLLFMYQVAKGLSKDDKAQKLAIQHWLEAIDPRHRYGHNLNLYYDIWFKSESAQPFFFWLDIGDGKEVNLENCPRIRLQQQCIKYLGPNERRSYEVIVEEGKLVYKESGMFVNSVDGSKWIFVLSTHRRLYVGQKIKGFFQHSSFLAGGATTSAGRLVAKQGILKGIWPYSGHYLPTEENFKEFIHFLQDNNVDLTEVKRYSIHEDNESSMSQPIINDVEIAEDLPKLKTGESGEQEEEEACAESSSVLGVLKTKMNTGNHLHCKWATGFGPRISCVREYPADLQFKALEQVNLSPRPNPSSAGNSYPIPSPRPSPAMRLSPRLAQLGIA